MKKTYLLVALIIVLIITIVAHTGNQSKTPQVVGVILPLSGPAGDVGQKVKLGLELAPLKNITLEYQDDECDSKKAISAYNALKLKGIKVYYAACSGSVLALAPLIKADGNLMVVTFAGSSEIRKTGPEVIRLNPDALSVVAEMNAYIAKAPFKKYGLLYEAQDYPKSVADSIRAKLGNKLVVEETYDAKNISFKTELLKFRNNVDAIVYIPVSDKAEKILLNEMRTLGLKAFIIGDINVCDYDYKPSDIGLWGVCWKTKLPEDKQKKFDAIYLAKYGVASQYPFYDAIGYDLMITLDGLMTRGATVSDIQASLLSGVDGPISSYKFDKDGEVEAHEYLEQFEMKP